MASAVAVPSVHASTLAFFSKVLFIVTDTCKRVSSSVTDDNATSIDAPKVLRLSVIAHMYPLMISSFAARAGLVLVLLARFAELFLLHAANRVDEHLL